MQVVYTDRHARHHPRTYFKAGAFPAHPETPARAEAILAAAKAAGHAVVAPEDYGPAPRAAIHTPAYLDFLASAYERWQALKPEIDEVLPNVHPGRHMGSMPEGIIGRAGYFTADMSAPIGAHTWDAACWSANCAVRATRLVLDGRKNGVRAAYSLGRPPGHHAFTDQAGGFCFLNNIAIAAEYARGEVRRAAILDVDVHHGNGTQGIFYRRRDVLTDSLHCDTTGFYPWFAGRAHETGEGEGRGFNHNFPLPQGSSDNSVLDALASALGIVRAYAPDLLFVALGVDGYERDPLDGFRVTTEGFGRIGAAIGELGLPTVITQEGGYHVGDLGKNVTAFLGGFERTHG